MFDINDCIDITPDGKVELFPQQENIWKQKVVGTSLSVCGFYEFKTGIAKKDSKPFAILMAASRLNILTFIEQQGYFKRYHGNDYQIVKVENNIIEPVTIDIIRVKVFAEAKKAKPILITVEDEIFTFSNELCLSIYLKNQDQIFNKNFLELLTEYIVPELRETSNIAYFLFTNTIIEVNADKVKPIEYEDLKYLDRCVWKSHIMQRDYLENKKTSEFEKFINNVASHELSRINAFKSAIGYLLHYYNGQHMGQAVVLYDEKPTDVRNPQGGTGKGLFSQGISFMVEASKIDGKHIKADDRFRFQTVKETSQVIIIDDLAKEVPFETFFSCLTDGWTIEKKNKPTVRIEPEDSPKMLFTMNTVITGNGTSHKRRIFILEFSDHYSCKIKHGNEHPIEDEHGVLFDRLNWSQSDWDKFTTFMIGCVSYYLKNDLQPYALINVGKNSLIQVTGEDFSEWVDEQAFQLEFYYHTKEMFEAFRNRYYGENSEYKQRTFTNNLKKYADTLGWVCKVITDRNTGKSEFIFKNPD